MRLAIIPLLGILAGCANFDTAGTVSGNLDKATAVTAEGLKEIILVRCNELSEVRRKKLLTEVNDLIQPRRAFALDCNADGKPDF